MLMFFVVGNVYTGFHCHYSADISQLWVYLCYLIYCLRLLNFVVVYKLVMFMERG